MVCLARTGILFLWLPVALGQVITSPPQSSSASQAAQLCRVEGVVVDAITRQPLHKISLSLDNQNPPSVTTAASAYTQPESYTAVSDDTCASDGLLSKPYTRTLDALFTRHAYCQGCAHSPGFAIAARFVVTILFKI
jgi:hypothetical protein